MIVCLFIHLAQSLCVQTLLSDTPKISSIPLKSNRINQRLRDRSWKLRRKYELRGFAINTKILLWLFWLGAFTLAVSATSVYVYKITTQQGMVTGILYAMEESSAVIDRQVVRTGDTLHGVKIVSIDRFTVEFEKDGTRWKQRVREKPNPAWQSP